MDNDINEVNILPNEKAESSNSEQHVAQESPLKAVMAIAIMLIVLVIGSGLLRNAMDQAIYGPEGKTEKSTSTTSDSGDPLMLTQ